MQYISSLIGLDIKIGKKYSEAICINLKEIFLAEGIDVDIKTYSNDEKFMILKKMQRYVSPVFHLSDIPIINIPDDAEKEKFHGFLNNNKLFNSKLLACPRCNRYSVEYSNPNFRRSLSKWWCRDCKRHMSYYGYSLNIDDRDKYKIYKLWGLDALNNLMNEPLSRTMNFIGNYFKNCCVSKKDRCIYSNFFEEEEIEKVSE